MPDKLLFVGLGNPGRRSAGSRHNIGFMVADELAARNRQSFRSGPGEYLLCRIQLTACEILLQKPLTFMNLSGHAVRHALAYYRFSTAELLVICDDFNLPFGRLRFRGHGSDGGHNGLASVIADLGTDQFSRLRVGISRDFSEGEQVDYVLSPFSPEERKELQSVIAHAADAVTTFAEQGLEAAMNQYN